MKVFTSKATVTAGHDSGFEKDPVPIMLATSTALAPHGPCRDEPGILGG
jgi:hypothetical protein